MKKQILLLLAGSAMVITSCNQPVDNGTTEAQIDSMVDARVEEIRAQLMAQNDSLINVLAQERADSIIAAMSGKKTTTRRSTGNTSTTNEGTSKEDKPATPTSSDRPGATNQGGVKKSTDRPGATNQGEKKASDRPGSR